MENFCNIIDSFYLRMPYRVLTGFIKRELKNVESYLEDENVELEAFDINGDLLKIKLHKVKFNLNALKNEI